MSQRTFEEMGAQLRRQVGGKGVRQVIVGILFVALLIYGPFFPNHPQGLLIRLGYLLAVPAGLWFLLKWVWRRYEVSPEMSAHVGSVVGGVVAGLLFAMAYGDLTTDFYRGCVERVSLGRGETECIEFAMLPGPNLSGAIVKTLLAAGALSISLYFGPRRPARKKRYIFDADENAEADESEE